MLSHRFVAVVSDRLAKELFPFEDDVLGREIKISLVGHARPFLIVGIYEYTSEIPDFLSQFMGRVAGRTDVYIPLTTANMFRGGSTGYQSFVVMTKQDVDITAFAAQIRSYLNIFYDDNPRFWIATLGMDRVMDITETIMDVMSVAVAVIAGISLVVGGVGVMNIMLVSVTERTREIGTRKALGARNSSIRIQFLVEAVIICAIGGVLGVAFGVALGYLGSLILGHPGWPTAGIVFIAVLFSMAVGLFFGYYPANKAAKLDPIEALRYE
jgi:putative ABC transport system permease protein